MRFRRMTVIGVGLVGGSLARAMKDRGLVGDVVGVGRGEANLKRAVEMGVIDEFTHDPAEGVRGATLVVLATPVGTFEPIAREIKPHLDPQAIVTDVGSVKGEVVRALEDLLEESAAFVGSHPIAGGEKSGVEASDPSIFDGARCVLTPTPRTRGFAIDRVEALWQAVGCRTLRLDPDIHDKIFAAVSHLPHAAAFALVAAVERLDGGLDLKNFSGGGYRDATRIGASPADVWRDIFLLNREHTVSALRAFEEEIAAIRREIEEGRAEELKERLSRISQVRRSLPNAEKKAGSEG
jgi:prephenate dehydrogenase